MGAKRLAASEKKHADQILPESEVTFPTLADTTSAAIFIFQGRRNRYVNPAAEIITGYTQEELLGMNFWQVVHPDFRDTVKARGLARQQGGQVPDWYELKILTKNGQERWISANLAKTEFDGQAAVLGTAFDITDRKEAEQALKKSQANLRAIFDNSLQAFILIDLEQKIQAFNQTACRLLGRELQLGSSLQAFVPDRDLTEFDQYLNQALTGQSVSIEKKIKIDHRNHWFQLNFDPVFIENDQIIGLCFSVLNIDKLKEALGSLTEREARLLQEMQSVLATTRALVSELNLDTLLEFIVAQAGHLMHADGAAVFLLSDDGQQLEIATPGETWLQIKPGSRFPIRDSLAEAALASRQVQVCNHILDNDLTAPICAILSATRCHALLCAPLAADGESLGVLLIWSDREHSFSMSDSRLIGLFADQAALALHNARLHRQNRRLAIEQERHRLARDLHDSVTQSLYSIGLAAESALKWLEPGRHHQLQDPLEYIQTLSRTSLAEVREQIYHLHPTILNEKGLVKALARYCEILSNRYSLTIDLISNPEPVLSTQQQEELYYIAREALWNIVKHADAARVKLGLTTAADQTMLTIADDGIGFEPALFVEGNTIGLRNMEERAKFLGGTFELIASPGQGTRITVHIPI